MTAKLDGTNGLLQQYDYQVLTTGFAYTFAAGTQTLIANPAGTLATGTITMPAAPADGMTITFISTQQITALTINGNTGQTVVSKPALLYANQALSYVYRLSNTTWYPVVSQVASSIGPAFSAYLGTNQAISAATYTKIQFNTEEFDTNSNYDNVTNYRFTPTVAGYYQINAAWQTTAIGASGQVYIVVYKNGTAYKDGNYAGVSSGNAFGAVASVLVYCNGTSDYIEIYAYQGNAANITGGSRYSYVNGFLARGA